MGTRPLTEVQEQVNVLQVHRDRFHVCPDLLKVLFHLLSMTGSYSDGYISLFLQGRYRQAFEFLKEEQV